MFAIFEENLAFFEDGANAKRTEKEGEIRAISGRASGAGNPNPWNGLFFERGGFFGRGGHFDHRVTQDALAQHIAPH